MITCDAKDSIALFYRTDNDEIVLSLSDLKFKPAVGDIFEIDGLPWVVEKVVAVMDSRTIMGQESIWFRYEIGVKPDLR